MPEEQFQSSSFIPKGAAHYRQPSHVDSSDSGGGGSHKGLLLTISIVLSSIAALAAGGVFFYTQYLESDLADKKQELAQAQAAFEPEVIEELEKIDTRISSAAEILNNHTAVTPVFDVIESITLASVQLTNLSVHSRTGMMTTSEAQDASDELPEGVEEDDGDVVVSLTGIARDYASVQLQAQALEENEEILNPELSDFSLNEQGNVVFSIDFTLDEEYMSYESTI